MSRATVTEYGGGIGGSTSICPLMPKPLTCTATEGGK